MTIPTFTPPVGPSPGTSYERKINLYEAEFGDGYSQPTPKGINHVKKGVSLKWSTLTYTEMRQIISFFESLQGNKPFWFQPFGQPTTVKWTCKDYAETTDDGIWSITAKFVESFSAEI
jgi:phage-related protein